MLPRIVTLTLNPAIDVACEADSVRPQHKIRTDNETHGPGGGGVNVARVIHELGGDTCAIVLSGGVPGHEYRFVPEGPIVSPAERAATQDAVAAEPTDWLVASGSLPRGAGSRPATAPPPGSAGSPQAWHRAH